jgi:hypothetical protein
MARLLSFSGIVTKGPSALVFVTCAAALSACSGSSPTEPGPLTACGGPVTVSVSAGTTPTFTWTPSCSVFAVLVEDVSSDTWYLFKQGGGIAPGVRYGVVPQGAVQDAPAIPLQAGRAYEAILFSGTTQDTMTLIARRTFTPQ